MPIAVELQDKGLVLDDVDQRILEALRHDGRNPFRALAKSLGLTESTVRARIRRLEESDTMRVVAVTDFKAAGFELLLAVGIQVEGRSVEQVSTDLAAIPEVFSVSMVVGTYDIEILAVAEDQRSLSELLNERIAKLPGVQRLLPSLAMEVLKNRPDWVPFRHLDLELPALSCQAEGRQGRLDEVDRRILSYLSQDARTSNRKIAAELGVTEGTVRSRIKRMEDEGLTRITAITNFDRLNNPALAFIWIETDTSRQTRDVAAQLATLAEIGFAGVMLGRYDILVITLVQRPEQLSEFLHSRIYAVEGVRRTECTLGVNFVKHDYRMSRIVRSRGG